MSQAEQPELLPGLASVAPAKGFHERGEFEEVEVHGNVVRLPASRWKDGRRRADLSQWGAGEVVSRNDENFERAIREKLEPFFHEMKETMVGALMREAKTAKPRRERRKAAGKIEEPEAHLFFDPQKDFTNEPFSSPFNAIVRIKNSALSPLAKVLWGVVRSRLWPKNRAVVELRPGKVGLPLRSRELAEAVGASRRGVLNALNEMKRAGFLWWPEGPGAWDMTVFLLRHESFAGDETLLPDASNLATG